MRAPAVLGRTGTRGDAGKRRVEAIRGRGGRSPNPLCPVRTCLVAGASRIRTLGPTLSLGPAAWVELVRLAARDRTDTAIAKPEPPFVRVDERGGQFPGMPGAPSHGQNRGLAVGAADQAPRACDSAPRSDRKRTRDLTFGG